MIGCWPTQLFIYIVDLICWAAELWCLWIGVRRFRCDDVIVRVDESIFFRGREAGHVRRIRFSCHVRRPQRRTAAPTAIREAVQALGIEAARRVGTPARSRAPAATASAGSRYIGGRGSAHWQGQRGAGVEHPRRDLVIGSGTGVRGARRTRSPRANPASGISSRSPRRCGFTGGELTRLPRKWLVQRMFSARRHLPSRIRTRTYIRSYIGLLTQTSWQGRKLWITAARPRRLVDMAQSRRTKIPAEEKTRLVLAVLAGEMTGAEAARVVESPREGDQVEAPVPRRPGPSGCRRYPAAPPTVRAVPSSGGCGWRTSNSSWRWPRPRCSCGSGSGGQPWPIRSLRRPRSPKSGGGDAGFEVRCAGRHPGTDLSASAGSATGRGCAKGPWPAPRVDASKRWPRSMPETGRRGASQGRGHDARRRARGLHLDRATRLTPAGLLLPRGSGPTANRGRCFVGASFMIHPPTATGSGRPTSANSKPLRRIWRISAVIDYVTKYCLAITVTTTCRGADALRCLELAVAEAQRVLA